MEAFILLIVIALFCAIWLLWKHWNKRCEKIVIAHSKLLLALNAINERTHFYELEKDFSVDQHYDNKSNYNRVQPAFLMNAFLKDHIVFFTNYIQCLLKNRETYDRYIREINALSSVITHEECKALKIPFKKFIKYEKKQFFTKALRPTCDCSVLVTMSYTSPQGRVHEEKQEIFLFDEMRESFESISRKTLSKEVKASLVTVERGKMSDSLRYDVLKRDGFRCVICGASQNVGARLHIDHIVPVSKGGKTEIGNLRTLCERCNIGKSDKIEEPSKNIRYTCPRCGETLVRRQGKFGDFYGCSGYPECTFTQKIN